MKLGRHIDWNNAQINYQGRKSLVFTGSHKSNVWIITALLRKMIAKRIIRLCKNLYSLGLGIAVYIIKVWMGMPLSW